MTDYPVYNYNLLARFVEGNVQGRIQKLYEEINSFIEGNAPILEDIQQRTNILNNIPFGKLNRAIIEDSLRNDYAGAKKGLGVYNRIFGKVDLYLGLMTSNYKLPQFLRENQIPQEQITFFQKELQIYWEDTYGYHLNHLELCLKLLKQLRDILEEEVKILERIPQQSYLSALQENERLSELFQKEIATFWQLVETAQFQEVEANKLASSLKAQIKKVRVQIGVYKEIIRKGVGKDFQESKTNLERALIALIFLIGAANLIKSIPQKLKKKGISKIFNFFSSEERLSNEGRILLAEATELLTS